jgi:hypothetical protein
MMPKIDSLNEGQKPFKVSMWFGAYKTNLVIFSYNGASAMVLARKMFPNSKVYSATEVKGKLF